MVHEKPIFAQTQISEKGGYTQRLFRGKTVHF